MVYYRTDQLLSQCDNHICCIADMNSSSESIFFVLLISTILYVRRVDGNLLRLLKVRTRINNHLFALWLNHCSILLSHNSNCHNKREKAKHRSVVMKDIVIMCCYLYCLNSTATNLYTERTKKKKSNDLLSCRRRGTNCCSFS